MIKDHRLSDPEYLTSRIKVLEAECDRTRRSHPYSDWDTSISRQIESLEEEIYELKYRLSEMGVQYHQTVWDNGGRISS